jgi:hypothetical protein
MKGYGEGIRNNKKNEPVSQAGGELTLRQVNWRTRMEWIAQAGANE